MTVYTETPTMYALARYENGRADGYDVEYQLTPANDHDALLASDAPAPEGYDDTFSYVSWTVADGVLQSGSEYAVRARMTHGDYTSDWSSWRSLTIGIPVQDPTDLAPEEGHTFVLDDEDAVLQARVPDAAPGTEVAFEVQTGWQYGNPQKVATVWATVDDNGVARQKVLPSSKFPNGLFRWRVMSASGPTSSDWTSWREFWAVTKPKAVTGVTVTPGYRSAQILWDWSNDCYGNVCNSNFTAELLPEHQTLTARALYNNSLRFENLHTGEHQIALHATNSWGDGPVTTYPVTIGPGRPFAPENVTVTTPAKNSAEISWDPPTDTGGSAIDHYELNWSGYQDSEPHTLSTTETHATLTDLAGGDDYRLSVRAVNELGDGDEEWAFFAPFGVPDAVTDLVVQPGDGFADVSWRAANPKGSKVTKYTVTAAPGGATKTYDPVSDPMGVKFTGLDNDTAYTFTITATNDAGDGPGAVTESVTPQSQATDTDEDGLPDVVEKRAGTDSHLPDSDNDGIGDKDEVLKLSAATSPVDPDTDHNGTLDGDEDADHDSISNIDELHDGTNPLLDDSDADGLLDSDEPQHHTDPTRADSDADTLSDGFELAAGTDPTKADSDGDGSSDATASVHLATVGERVVSNTVTELQLPSVEEWKASQDGQLPGDPPVLENGQPIPTDASEGAYLSTVTAQIDGTARVLTSFRADAGSGQSIAGAITGVASIQRNQTNQDDGIGADPAPVLRALALSVRPNLSAEQTANLAPVEWDGSTWAFSDKHISYSTASETVTIDAPDLGVQYAVVDLNQWRTNALECSDAQGGDPQLDVQVILDQTFTVASADPTNERYDALLGVLRQLHAGDRIFWNLPQVLTIDYGYGYSFEGQGGGVPKERTDKNGRRSYDTESASMRPSAAIGYVNQLKAAGPLPTHLDGFDGWAYAGDDLSVDTYERDHMLGDLDYWDGTPETNPYTHDKVDSCRQHVVVLVTDGKLTPIMDPGKPDADGKWEGFERGYTPFIERTDPVHVLDVGDGGDDADWLKELADRTDGTYSFVPSAADTDWVHNPHDASPAGDTTTDSDGDGLTDWIETHGFTNSMAPKGAGMPYRYFSNPQSADSDDDGVPDAEEVGHPTPVNHLGVAWHSGFPQSSYVVYSDPEFADGDGDGLSDSEELETGVFNPLNIDEDFDGLTDDLEAQWGTFPFLADSDSDGYSDFEETTLHPDEGYNPTLFNGVMSGQAALQDFLIGMFCGDFDVCQRDSIPWLTGSILSGVLVYGDVRDVVVNTFKGDFVMAGIVLVGVIPGVGDGAETIGKVAKFVRRVADHRDTVLSAMRILSDALDDPKAFVAAVRQVEPDLARVIDRHGLDAADAKRLILDNDPGKLKALLDDPDIRVTRLSDYPTGKAPGFLNTGKKGEEQLKDFVGVNADFKQQRWSIGNTVDYGRGSRYYDAFRRNQDQVVCYEAKVGYGTGSFAANQMSKDAALLALGRSSSDPGKRSCNATEWHLFASAVTGRIGASSDMIARTKELGIKIVVHLPR